MEYKSVDVRVLFGSGSASRLELVPWLLKFAWACGLHVKCGKQVMCNEAPKRRAAADTFKEQLVLGARGKHLCARLVGWTSPWRR